MNHSPALATPLLLPVAAIQPGNNDRTRFDKADLRALADSIAEHGLLQPISVRAFGNEGQFQIIAGERRWRAVQLLEREHVSAFVLQVTDEEAAALMLVENTARKDLDPLDEATAYAARMRNFGWTEAEVAKKAGVSDTRVRGRVKLLRLCSTVQTLVRSGQLYMNYAQCMADAGLDPTRQLQAVQILNDRQRPTIDWFKAIVSDLLEKQTQGVMFDELELGPTVEKQAAANTPAITGPLPQAIRDAPPPKPESDPRSIMEWQRDWWLDAAARWEASRSWWYAKECRIAAKSIENIMAATGGAS